jgi:hypothetical protein
MPRTGGAYYPAARIDRRKVGRARGYRTSRVLITRLGPGGAVTTVYDYELAPNARGWRVVNRFPVLAVD